MNQERVAEYMRRYVDWDLYQLELAKKDVLDDIFEASAERKPMEQVADLTDELRALSALIFLRKQGLSVPSILRGDNHE